MPISSIDILNLIPVLTDAHKKTPIEPRIEAMNSLLNIDHFHSVEPTLIDSILPIVLKRLDDKPKVVEKAMQDAEYKCQGLPFSLPNDKKLDGGEYNNSNFRAPELF